ncbi:MAG: VWA domain-containing protein [Bacteroidota bacterium]
MEIQTVLLIIAAAVLALAIVVFQYHFRGKGSSNLRILLSVLRFFALFGILVLLINPKFTKKDIHLEKPLLLLLVDNSMSVETSKDTLQNVLNELREKKELSERFTTQTYTFGTDLRALDSLNFKERHTNIQKALSSLEDIHSQAHKIILLLTDGNQTKGADYLFASKNTNTPVYPLVIGDTTRYEDIRIERVIVNTYAFLKNKFPVEIHVDYEGQGSITSTYTIKVNGRTVKTQSLALSASNSSLILSELLNADTVGPKTIEVFLEPLNNERNVFNNTKSVGVEVIDEKTNVVIVSNMPHPDIGALKNAIESNEQRSVSVQRPGIPMTEMEDADMFVLYQPNTAFSPIYDYLKKREVNYLTVAGSEVDWSFLNKVQSSFSKDGFGEKEEIFPAVNPAFGFFDITDFSTEGFPPLQSELGEIQIYKPHEVLLGQRIRGVDVNDPLLAVIGNDQEREVVLFGEDFWKWRMQSYRNEADFSNFDELMGKLLLYLSNDRSKNRLDVDYDLVYENNGDTRIYARYFDEAYEIDADAQLTIHVKSRETGFNKEIPMLLGDNRYEVDLGEVPPGAYTFEVTVKDKNIRSSGNFSIMDFNVEQQLRSSDHGRLAQLALNTGGKLFFPRELRNLENELLRDPRFLPIQKSREIVVSLIDFRMLLFFIIILLAMEWFIRKYNGLI